MWSNPKKRIKGDPVTSSTPRLVPFGEWATLFPNLSKSSQQCSSLFVYVVGACLCAVYVLMSVGFLQVSI